MEMTAVTAAMAGIRNAIEIARVIKESKDSLKEAEVNSKIADLVSELAETKLQIVSIREIISEKDAEILELRNQIEIKKNLVWERPYYYIVLDNGEKDGPYCQKCQDGDGKLIRLQSSRREGFWKCSVCTNQFLDKNYREPSIR